MENLKYRNIIDQMTLEEKAGLLSGADSWHTKAVARLGIPSIMMTDGPHGIRKMTDETLGQMNSNVTSTCFPTASLSACSWDRELMRKLGKAIAEEARQEKVSIVLGPGTNIKRSPLCGRNFEYFSEDPYLAGELAGNFIKGVENEGIGTSLKHYCANNQEYMRLTVSSVMDERTLREVYLAPFERAVRIGKPSTVMCAYNKLNGVYCSENKKILTDILRDEWGFDGVVMSDWGAVCDRVAGVEAGLELEMPSSGGVNEEKIVLAVKEGRLDVAVLDRAVDRMLNLIFKFADVNKSEYKYNKDEHKKLAVKIAEESAVLLQNYDDLLPFDKEEKILVVGEFAEKLRYQGGGSSHITPPYVISILEGLDRIGANYEYIMGFDVDNNNIDLKNIQLITNKATKFDKVLICVGLSESREVEGVDRKNMEIPEIQSFLINEIAKANENVAVVVQCGSPIEMLWSESVKSILMMYLSGNNGGLAAARLLYGEANPCGKLAETLPEFSYDCGCYHDFVYDEYETYYTEALYVGYKYYDKARIPVQFPFGHGLSYTKFVYDNIRVNEEITKAKNNIVVSVDVTNIGRYYGKEIVQIYSHKVKSKLFRPMKELVGFEKVALEPNETKTVKIIIPAKDLRYYDIVNNKFQVEDGIYELVVARSSNEFVEKITVDIDSDDIVAVKYSEALDWYWYPIGNEVPFDQFELLLGRKIDKTRPIFKKGSYTVNNTLKDMSKDNWFIRKAIKIANYGTRKYLKVPKNDSGYMMMKEVFVTTPLYKLSANSQGVFNMEMAEGLLQMANGKFFKGLCYLISHSKKK